MVRRLDSLDVSGKRVLVRLDLNVPVKDDRVTDATRITRSLPTLRHLVDAGARIVVLSHFGRPKGEVVAGMSLAPVVAVLGRALDGVDVSFAEDCVGPVARRQVDALAPGSVLVLENTRFHPGEEANDPSFVDQLAALGDAYVNDAFSAAHRAHASTEGLARRLPSAAGLAMTGELEALAAVVEQPARPVMAIVGGAKVSTKLELLGHLIDKVDRLAIGGGMANTFLHAMGKPVGRSLCEPDLAETALDVAARAEEAGCMLLLQTDAVIAAELAEGVATEVVPVDRVPEDKMILDIGPETLNRLQQSLESCATLLWNGPVGAFEVPPFDAATVALAKTAASMTRAGRLITVAGGGDTVAAVAKAGVMDDFTYVSTAGGAFLEFLEGHTLPGVAALEG